MREQTPIWHSHENNFFSHTQAWCAFSMQWLFLCYFCPHAPSCSLILPQRSRPAIKCIYTSYRSSAWPITRCQVVKISAAFQWRGSAELESVSYNQSQDTQSAISDWWANVLPRGFWLPLPIGWALSENRPSCHHASHVHLVIFAVSIILTRSLQLFFFFHPLRLFLCLEMCIHWKGKQVYPGLNLSMRQSMVIGRPKPSGGV